MQRLPNNTKYDTQFTLVDIAVTKRQREWERSLSCKDQTLAENLFILLCKTYKSHQSAKLHFLNNAF